MTDAETLPDSSALLVLRLRPRADKRLKQGHQWIYSNEIDTGFNSLKGLQPGVQAVIENHQGRALGIATINPHTLLCGRLVSRDIQYPLNKSLLVHRIQQALSLRERYFAKPFYRLVYGDSDLLSGLVVDRFGQTLVVQINSAGMELVKDEIITALEQVLKPAVIVLKNDGGQRDLEGLPHYLETPLGELPEVLHVEENGSEFRAPLAAGQKTGWFYDHRLGRKALLDWVSGKRVLDVFSYVGAWGIPCLAAGANHLSCVDSSQLALQYAQENAAIAGHAEHYRGLCGNAFEVLQNLCDEGEKFDVIVVDPPAFIKRKKDLGQGQQAYRRINELAMRLLSNDGLLVAGSCSMQMSREMLTEALRAGARHIDRQAQLVLQTQQGPDHPIHPAIPETEYLKAQFLRVYKA